jgi:uncharacterized membrane protein (DUF4010 family)
MSVRDDTLLGLAVALGCGLLIGIERERRKGTGPDRALAGIRTFTLASLTGALAAAVGEPLLLAAGAVLVVGLAMIGYMHERRRGPRDPGVTTELALFVTFVLGVTAIERPSVAGAGAVIVAIMLAARSQLHRFSTVLVTADELRDGLLLAAAALIVLPLVPSRPIAWLAGVDPRRFWALVVLLMALQAAGHVALRIAGARIGLPLAGFVSGFISSTATVAAMGTRARAEPAHLPACVSGALFSNVATAVQLALVAATVHPAALTVIGPALGLGAAAAVFVAVSSLRRIRAIHTHRPSGRVFSMRAAVVLAALLTAVTATASVATATYGTAAVDTTAALAGFVDVHAAAAAVLALAAGGKIAMSTVLFPVLVAFTTNTASKIVAAWMTGGRSYGLRVTIGLLVMGAGVWAPWLAAPVGVESSG